MTTPEPPIREPATPRTDEIDSSRGHLIPIAMLPGGPATEEDGPTVPEPSHAERARTLTADATHLSATDVDHQDLERWRVRVEVVRCIGGFGLPAPRHRGARPTTRTLITEGGDR